MLHKKKNEAREEGFVTTYTPYSPCRRKSHGHARLRRRHCEHCYHQHCLGEGRIEAIAAFNNVKNRKTNKNVKTRVQGMLDNFFAVKEESNENKNTVNETNKNHFV